MPTIAALYLRNLYVASERRSRSGLDGRPVMVCGRQRVLDASVEAQAFGIRTGQPRSVAHRFCPQAASLDFAPDRYGEIAREALDLAAHYSPFVEPLYLHEFLIDLTGCSSRTWEELHERLGWRGFIPLLGVASTRLTARAIALSLNRHRPAGQGEVQYPPELVFLHSAPIGALWPVAPAHRERLRRLGLRTIGEVAATPSDELVRQLGPAGERISRLSRGIDPSRVPAAYPPPSIEAGLTLDHGLTEEEPIRHALETLVARVGADLRRRHEGCGRLRVALEYAGRPAVETVILLRSGVRSDEELYRTAWRAIDRLRIDAPVVGVRIRAEELRVASGVQLDLFGVQERKGRLLGLFDTVRRRFGDAGIQYASELTVPRRVRVFDLLLVSYGLRHG